MSGLRDIRDRDLDFADHLAFGLGAPTTPTGALRLVDFAFGVASAAALTATDASILGTGSLRWVETFRRWFTLDKSTAGNGLALATGSVILANDGSSTRVGAWIDAGNTDAYWLAQTSWIVDPAGGNDESTTTTVKTRAELNRRLLGFDGSISIVITLAGDIPTSDAGVMTSLRSKDAAHFVTILGTKTLLGTYTIGTYAAGDPTVGSGGTQFTITATGIGAGGNVDGLVINGSGVGVFILSSLGANEVSVGEPTNADPSTITRGNPTPFSNGDTVHVYSLTKLPFWPFPPNLLAPVLGWVKLQSTADSGIPTNYMLGTSAPRLIQCLVGGGVFRGGYSGISTVPTNKGVFASCSFVGTVIEFIGNVTTIRSCSLRGCVIALISSSWNCIGTFVMEASSIECQSVAQFNSFATCCFNSTDSLSLGIAAFVSFYGCHVILDGSGFWGTGNTDYAIYAQAGSVNVIAVTTLNWITSEGHDLWVSGNEYFFADIPTGNSVDLVSLTSITNRAT